MGTMKIETLGKISFVDKKNQMIALLEIGKVKKKPSDYFIGEI
jgi:hypothetical protein